MGCCLGLINDNLSGSVSLTRRVAEALAVEAITRNQAGVATTIGWDVDVGNELRTAFYGTLPVAMRINQAMIDDETDYEGAQFCIQDAADGWIREKCSDR